MIRATVARTPTGRTLLVVRCPRCGWHADIDPRRLLQATRHRCPRQLHLEENQ